MQLKYDIAKDYADHIRLVTADRDLENYLSVTCLQICFEVLNAFNIWYLLPRLNLLWSIQGTHCSSTWCHGWLMFRYCHGPKFCIIYYVPCFLLWAIPSGRNGSIQMVVATASARKGLEERNATATPKDADSRMLEPCLMEIMMPSRFQHCSP